MQRPTRYQHQSRYLVAVDCIIFGFDGTDLKLLIIRRGIAPQKGKWSLMGGFVQPDESTETAAARILRDMTGLKGVYLEELNVFSAPRRDPIERTLSVAYFALLDIHRYEEQLTDKYQAAWVPAGKVPRLIFDHNRMVDAAREKLKYKALLHPVLFELLPPKFTLPQIYRLYRGVFGRQPDKRNFFRKLLASGLLVRLNEKEKENSRKGAYYYRLDKRKYRARFHEISSLVPRSALPR